MLVKADGYWFENNPPQMSYDLEYWERYWNYRDTPIAQCITNFRINLTKSCKTILDIGIGSGEFLEARGNCFGYDINPYAIKWLKDKKLFLNPYEELPKDIGISMFDCLEHVPEPRKLLEKLTGLLFISIPLFENQDLASIMSSKHYRPKEHYFYPSTKGLINFLGYCGYELVEGPLDDEVKCGREQIASFVFKKENIWKIKR